MKRLVVALAVLLAGCQTTGESAGVMRDQVGNVYPPECRGPLTCRDNGICDLNGKSVFVRPIPRSQLPVGYLEIHNHGLVLIDAGATGWKRDDLIRHGACHWVAGKWHPDSEVRK